MVARILPFMERVQFSVVSSLGSHSRCSCLLWRCWLCWILGYCRWRLVRGEMVSTADALIYCLQRTFSDCFGGFPLGSSVVVQSWWNSVLTLQQWSRCCDAVVNGWNPLSFKLFLWYCLFWSGFKTDKDLEGTCSLRSNRFRASLSSISCALAPTFA